MVSSHPRAKLTQLIALTATCGVWGTQRTHPARLTHPKARPIAPCLWVVGQLWALPSASPEGNNSSRCPPADSLLH